MRILVVDDDPEIRALLRTVLTETGFGFELCEAADGGAALEALERAVVDIVLLDVMMPGMDGFEALASIRARLEFATLPVVMLTARTGESDHITALRLGADAYLVKPFDIDELVAVIDEVLARPPASRAAVRESELGKAELLEQTEARLGD